MMSSQCAANLMWSVTLAAVSEIFPNNDKISLKCVANQTTRL